MSGWSRALVRAAALLARQAGGADQARERIGVVEQLAEAGGVAAQAGVAPERRAGGLAGRRGRLGSTALARRRRGRARRSPQAPPGGRTRGTRRASSRPAGWPRGGRCTRTRRPRRAPAATSARRGRWRSRPSCSAPRAPRGAGRGWGRARPPRARPRCWGSAPRPRRACRAGPPARRSAAARPRWRAPPRRAGPARPRSARPRRQQRRALAAHRLGHEEAVARAVEPQRGRVELHELEVGEHGARRRSPG